MEDPRNYEAFTWVGQHTQPADYFYDPVWGVDFCQDLRNPTPISIIKNNGYTTPEQVAEVIQGLDRHHVHYISWSPSDPDITSKQGNTSGDHLGPLRDYIYNHYRVVKVFANADQVWERND